MTDLTVTAAEPLDQSEPPEEAAKRAAFVADVRAFADWLADNPWVPLPTYMQATKQLNKMNGAREAAASSLATLWEIAGRLDADPDESLRDRTRIIADVGCVEYSLLTWHPDGRPDERDAELEKLRAEVAELRAGRSGMDFSDLADRLNSDGAPVPTTTAGYTNGDRSGALVEVHPAEPAAPTSST